MEMCTFIYAYYVRRWGYRVACILYSWQVDNEMSCKQTAKQPNSQRAKQPKEAKEETNHNTAFRSPDYMARIFSFLTLSVCGACSPLLLFSMKTLGVFLGSEHSTEERRIWCSVESLIRKLSAVYRSLCKIFMCGLKDSLLSQDEEIAWLHSNPIRLQPYLPVL